MYGIDRNNAATGGRAAGGFASGFLQGRANRRAEKASGQQDELFKLKIKELENDASFKEMQREQQGVIRSFVASNGNETQPVVDLMRKYNPEGEDLVADISRNEDGGYTMETELGKQTNYKNFDEMGRIIALMGRPDVWAKQMLKGPETKTVSDGADLVQFKDGKATVLYSNPKDKTGKGPGGKYNQQSAYTAIERGLVTRYGNKVDGEWMIPKKNSQAFSRASAVAQGLERKNPGAYAPGELVDLVYSARNSLISEGDARKQAKSEASDKATFGNLDSTDFKEDSGSSRAFIKRRTNEILQQNLDSVIEKINSFQNQGKAAGINRNTPPGGHKQTAAPQNASTTKEPTQIKTRQEFDSLAVGELYVHPKDGKTYKKK